MRVHPREPHAHVWRCRGKEIDFEKVVAKVFEREKHDRKLPRKNRKLSVFKATRHNFRSLLPQGES